MFERMSASWALVSSSWQVLRRDKQLIVFPILSGLGCVLVLITFAVPLAVLVPWARLANEQGDVIDRVPWWAYPVMFAFYFCNYFVVIFCNAALVSCALLRFHGQTPTVADGFRAASSRLPQILAWALVSATVGMVLKLIENVNEKVGQIVSALLGTAWTIMTYFVVPVLVVEKVGPFQAIRRSIEILRKTWGEALVGRLGLGLALFVLVLPGIALLALGAWACTVVGLAGVGVIALGVVYLLAWTAVGSALNVIFLSALYQYAAFDQIPRGFDADDMAHAFRSKK
jgi:hypothetical protein